jgi:hypothetical protein
MGPSDYDEFRFVRYCTLAEVRHYWRNTADGDAQQIRKCSRCKGCLVRPPHSFSCTLNKSATTSHCREYSNFYRSHSKRKTSKACISETKAHWTKGRNRYLFTFHLLSIDFIFVEIPYEILMTSLCRYVKLTHNRSCPPDRTIQLRKLSDGFVQTFLLYTTEI